MIHEDETRGVVASGDNHVCVSLFAVISRHDVIFVVVECITI